ncbi:MAG: hypothetical protein HUU34_03475 [Saprospiraceae bacterium]|jgi:tetratricopeptide (TPR) repeat protein|nr:hypothetical protein [Saprospiraceae bacterium]
MDNNQNAIQNRQKYFWLGKKLEEENALLEAVEAYITYSEHLSESDQHIPHQWIADIFDNLGELEKSLIYLEKYAIGCSSPVAAEVYKKIGDKYLTISQTEKAILYYEKAIENNNSIGIKKKLEELKTGLL